MPVAFPEGYCALFLNRESSSVSGVPLITTFTALTPVPHDRLMGSDFMAFIELPVNASVRFKIRVVIVKFPLGCVDANRENGNNIVKRPGVTITLLVKRPCFIRCNK
jgi:hypothetical protein